MLRTLGCTGREPTKVIFTRRTPDTMDDELSHELTVALHTIYLKQPASLLPPRRPRSCPCPCRDDCRSSCGHDAGRRGQIPGLEVAPLGNASCRRTPLPIWPLPWLYLQIVDGRGEEAASPVSGSGRWLYVSVGRLLDPISRQVG